MADAIAQDSVNTSNFRLVSKPVNHAPFRNLPGWKFDEGLWAAEDLTNSLIRLPLASQIDFSDVPEGFFKTGILEEGALEFDEIQIEDESFFTGWTPGVIRGAYTVYRSPRYLYSSDSIMLLVGTEQDTETLVLDALGATDPASERSVATLDVTPDHSIPISASYFRRLDDLSIQPFRPFRQVARFTGTAVNGIEQDGNVFSSTDTTLDEFIFDKNWDEPFEGLEIVEGVNATTAAGILRIALTGSPLPSFLVRFTRPDIFKRELSFAEWCSRKANPGTPLVEGDYAVGYRMTEGDGSGVTCYLGTNTYSNYGRVSYQPEPPGLIRFNKNVLESADTTLNAVGPHELTDVVESTSGAVYYLPYFPVLDLSALEDGGSLGTLVLDTTSTEVYVDSVLWTRVHDITTVNEAAAQNVYELNPLWGEIRFGNGGAEDLWGNRPDGTVTASWTITPIVRYDRLNSSKLFFDTSENLDPLKNSMKHGFLVLDDKRQVPWKIILTTSSPKSETTDPVLYGKMDAGLFSGLEVPPSAQSDITVLKARVIAAGEPTTGVPNIPVEFISEDGLLYFTQPFGVTDGDGYAYTEALGRSNFNNFVYSVHFYRATDVQILNPGPNTLIPNFSLISPLITDYESILSPWVGLTAAWEDNALVVEDYITGDVSDIYLLISSISGDDGLDNYDSDPLPSADDLVPYNSMTRDGGLVKVWSEEVSGAQEVIHPIEIIQDTPTQARLVFDRRLPLPIIGGVRRLIVGYKVVIDRTAKVHAETKEEPLLESNILTFSLVLNSTMKGQWDLPILLAPNSDGFQAEPEAEVLDSSRISTAVYMSPNDMLVTGITDGSDVVIDTAAPLSTVKIVGTNFPTQPELLPSVYIVKLSDSGALVSVKNITSSSAVMSSTLITIASLPAGQNGAGLYYIAVSGYSDLTSIPLTITG